MMVSDGDFIFYFLFLYIYRNMKRAVTDKHLILKKDQFKV